MSYIYKCPVGRRGLELTESMTNLAYAKVTCFSFIIIIVDFQDCNLWAVVLSKGKSNVLRIIKRL